MDGWMFDCVVWQAAKELGLLERERQVWECVSNCTC